MIDEWSGLAVLLADLIEKYATVLDIDSLPEKISGEDDTENIIGKDDVEKTLIA